MKSRSQQQTILIIDDNPTNLKVIVNYLKGHNLNIFIARSGKRGLERAKLARPDLILLDIVMPEMDGFEVCQKLKVHENTQDIPVIFMTAMTDPESKIRGFECGAVDYVTKPVEEAEVLARILTHLKLRDLSRNLEQKVKEQTHELRQANEELASEIAERKAVEAALLAQTETADNFSKKLAELHQVGLDLSLAVSLDDLCKKAVGFGCSLIGLDRLAIWFIDSQDPDYMAGTFGTDEQGQLRDERTKRIAIGSSLQKELLNKNVTLRYVPDGNLYNDSSQIIGRGEKVQATLWDSKKATGIITADNFLTRRPITEHERDLLVLFAQVVGHLSTLKRTEETLRESEERFRTLVQNSSDVIIILEENVSIRYVSPPIERILGYTPEEFENENPFTYTHPDDVGATQEKFAIVLQNPGTPIRHEFRIRHADGFWVNVETVTNNLLDNPGIGGIVVNSRDITERKQMEEMMLQSAKMASVGGLAAGVAHEINNPLGAMMQSAQMLQMAFDTQRPRTRELLENSGVSPDGLDTYLAERELNDYLDGIRTSGKRAAKIVADLLSFSRRSSSRIASYNLNALVEQTLDLALTDYDLKKRYDIRDIEIIRNFDSNLPQMHCDGQQIQQVVLNLVRNAAQSMRDTPEDSRLVITTGLQIRQHTNGEPEQWVRLEIEDNGPGIPEEINERLFEPFYTTKKVGGGTGLGLWLCWSIVVERHHGRIWTESTDDTPGSRFIVELPVNIKTSPQ